MHKAPILLIRDTLIYEMPLPLYVAMKIHSLTHNKILNDTLYDLGLCVSYDRHYTTT